MVQHACNSRLALNKTKTKQLRTRVYPEMFDDITINVKNDVLTDIFQTILVLEDKRMQKCINL